MTSLPYRSDIVDDPGFWQWEMGQMMLIEPLPAYLAATVPTSQPEPPSPFHALKVHFQQLVIPRYPEILVVAAQLLAQFLPLFLYRLMPILPAPLPEGLHDHPQLLGFGLSFDYPVSLP